MPETTDAALATRGTLGALPPGARLSHYEIISVLGQGGFGMTYRARDGALHRDVAIKEYMPTALAIRDGAATVLPRSTEVAQEFIEGRSRFLTEARTLAQLGDVPGIVRFLDFVEANGTAYLVMNLVGGQTLARALSQDGPLNSRKLEAMLPPLFDGLEQIHQAGFLHRDIKPANLLVDAKGTPTLIDFGAARAALAGHSIALTAIFTPGYAAPEQFTSGKQGPWTDIYGLSATLYHAITGKVPPSSFERILEDTYQSLAATAPPGLTYGTIAAIDAGLAVRAADRPQSIGELRELLRRERPADDHTVMLPKVPSEVAGRILGRSRFLERRSTRVAAGLVLVAALAVGGYSIWAPSDVSMATRPAGIAPLPVSSTATSVAPDSVQQRQLDEENRRAAEQLKTQQEAQRARDALAAAEAAQKRAEEEAARLRAEAQQRQAEREAVARAQAEEVERRRIEEEQRQKVEQEAAAKRRAGEEDKKAAEAAELALRLSPPDRQHIQVALSALGFDTRGSDGVFGARSREMIAAWQSSRKYAATGFLSAAQQATLLREAAPSVAKFEEEQRRRDDEEKKKAEEAKRKELEAAKAQPAPVTAAPTTPQATAPTAARDGLWFGAIQCKSAGRVSLQGSLSGGSGSLSGPGASISLSFNGDAGTIVVKSFPGGGSGQLAGKLSGRSLFAQGPIGAEQCTASLVGP